MKNLNKVIFSILTGWTMFSCTPVIISTGPQQKESTQVKKGGGPPPWAPAHGYRRNMRYYYLPDIAIYYDNQNSRYLWFDGVKWQSSNNIPSKYKSYNFETARKVQISYAGDDPYKDHEKHKKDYGKGNSQNTSNKSTNNSSIKTNNGNGNSNMKGNGNGNSNGKGKGNGNGNGNGNGKGNGKK